MNVVKHLCFTSHHEVMMRDPQDVGTMINFLALNSWKHKIQILADCEMSTHVHLVVLGADCNASVFIKDVRRQYTRYMDAKYGRPIRSRFGEKGYFALDVFGNSHIQSALSYVLRNPMHHGVTGTPFAYRYSSVNDIFPVDMGKLDQPRLASVNQIELRARRNGTLRVSERRQTQLVGSEMIDSRLEIAGYLPRDSQWPDEWKMSKDGVFLRPCFEELQMTERQFVSPASYQFNMLRKTDENWLEEQTQDGNGKPPVTLSDIEPFSNGEMIEQYKRNERASTFRKSGLNDFEICHLVDHDAVPALKCHSVYELTDSQKNAIRRMLTNELHVHDVQAARCVP